MRILRDLGWLSQQDTYLAGIAMPYIDSNSIKIYYEIHGQGVPVVLLHGFSSSFARNWLHLGWVDLLTARDYQVIGLDLRGHGNSDKPHDPASYGTEVMSRDVLNLLEHLTIKKVNLLGFSMGGGIALHLAMNNSELVHRVAVTGVGDAAIKGRHNPKQLAEITLALTVENPDREATVFGRQFRNLVDVPGNDLQALAALMDGPGWPGYVEGKRPITAPVLIVQAEHDEYMPEVQHLIAMMPRARLTILSGADHLTVIRDQRCQKEVLSFFDEGL